MSVAIALVGFALLPKMRWDTSIEQLFFSTTYLQNWYLAFNSVDYLARDNISSPVMHYWAMSAQIQALLLVAGLLWVQSFNAYKT